MFTLGLYFLIVAKLRVNKVFVSSKCPSSFLSPAGTWPGAGGQGVEWRSRAEGRGEGVRGGGAVLWLIRVHSFSTYASCTYSVQARGSRSGQQCARQAWSCPQGAQPGGETEGRWDTATKRGECGVQGEP